MRYEYGYLIKDLDTGLIDIETQHIQPKRVADRTALIEGYDWVRVKVTYTECEEHAGDEI